MLRTGPKVTLHGSNFSKVALGGKRGCSFSIFSHVPRKDGNKGMVMHLLSGRKGRITGSSMQMTTKG